MLDGHTVPDRLAFVLASHTAVLKQDSPRREAFHCMMEPYVHYVPVWRNLSNLVERVEWARAHDAEARQMAQRATELMHGAAHGLDERNRWCALDAALRAVGRAQGGAAMQPLMHQHACAIPRLLPTVEHTGEITPEPNTKWETLDPEECHVL